ncbi:Antirestriction protein (ArdA) [compost metagenome]
MAHHIDINEARIYVGTYAKYNDGSIAGGWLDLSDYSNKDEFYQACTQLHADEEDPEFMFQDYENIPEGSGE